MDVIYDDRDEAMAAVVTLKKFGADVRGPYGRQVEDYGEAPRYEWRVTAFGMIGADYEGADADPPIDSQFDREAEDRAIAVMKHHGLYDRYRPAP